MEMNKKLGITDNEVKYYRVFSGSGDEMVAQAIDSMGGYTMVLCSLKALLEHNVDLNLVADKAPDAHITDV